MKKEGQRRRRLRRGRVCAHACVCVCTRHQWYESSHTLCTYYTSVGCLTPRPGIIILPWLPLVAEIGFCVYMHSVCVCLCVCFACGATGQWATTPIVHGNYTDPSHLCCRGTDQKKPVCVFISSDWTACYAVAPLTSTEKRGFDLLELLYTNFFSM